MLRNLKPLTSAVISKVRDPCTLTLKQLLSLIHTQYQLQYIKLVNKIIYLLYLYIRDISILRLFFEKNKI